MNFNALYEHFPTAAGTAALIAIVVMAVLFALCHTFTRAAEESGVADGYDYQEDPIRIAQYVNMGRIF